MELSFKPELPIICSKDFSQDATLKSKSPAYMAATHSVTRPCTRKPTPLSLTLLSSVSNVQGRGTPFDVATLLLVQGRPDVPAFDADEEEGLRDVVIST